MLKSILMGGAMLLAIPALAQTTGTSASPTGTTTNDHDPTQADEQGMAATGTATTGSQVNGGVTSSSPGAHTGHAGAQGTMSTTTATGQSGNWSSIGNSGDTGAVGTGGGMIGSGTATGGAGMATGTAAGAGGPYQAARSYPPCTRTRTDSCRQRGGR